MDFLNKNEWSKNSSEIYVANNIKTETAYTDDMHNDMQKIENESWWFIYRADVIKTLMEKFFKKDRLTVDVGGGNGFTSSVAQKNGFNIGIIEPTFDACKNAQKKGIEKIACGAITKTSVIDESIDQIILLDVLEHIENDREFLNLLYKKLSKNGLIMITVPAFMCLWSSEDVAIGHFRRYRIKSLCKLMEECGFHIHYQSYFMSFLFFPILFIRVFLEKLGVLKKYELRTKEEKEKIVQSQFNYPKGIVKIVLEAFEKLEQLLMQKSKRIPFGSSILIIAKKKNPSVPD